MATPGPVVSASGFSKSFAGRTVLRDVDLAIGSGEVHGLLGQNGSGKSTFIKVLAGYHDPDPGAALTVAGREIAFPMHPGQSRALGLSFVHQDLGLLDDGTVMENLRIARYRTGRLWRIPWRRERASVRESMRRFGLDIDPATPVGSLREIDRALLAILRALEELESVETGLLVLDESTAYLPRDGIDQLFEAVREITRLGFGVLFVTHRLEEVRAITDHVTILRDGRLVASGATSSFSDDDLIRNIVGFSLDALYPDPYERDDSETVMSVRGLSGATVRGLDLDVARGEVIGLTGLLGTGFEEIPYLLFGARTASAGTVTLGGAEHAATTLTPRRAKEAGLALLPGSRARQGAVGAASVLENMTLTTVGQHFRGGRLRLRDERREVRRQVTQFDVRPPEPAREFSTLSGGNQQKALIAKWFATHPRVFLLDEPAQGVDVGARRQIFGHLRDASAAGTSFVIASTESEDLAHLCDRVLVFRDGVVVSELSGEQLTADRITEQSFRSVPQEAA
jgi:ribose transport system ATP-binding protein